MTAEATVQGIIDDARQAASDAAADAEVALNEAAAIARSFTQANPVQIGALGELTEPGTPDAPPALSVGISTGPRPSAPSHKSVLVPEILTAGDLPDEIQTDDLFVHEPPSINVGDVGPAPDVDTSVSLPAAPNLPIIDEPAITEPTLPDAPTVAAPAAPDTPVNFDVTKPGDLPDRYRTEFNDILPQLRGWIEQSCNDILAKINPDYTNQITKLDERIAQVLEDGNILPDKVREQIFNLRRDQAEGEALEQPAADEAARAGFTLPQGITVSHRRRIREGVAARTTRASTEVAIDEARRAQQNIQQIVQVSANLRLGMAGTMVQYVSVMARVNEQAISYAERVVRAIVENFNIEVRHLEAQLTHKNLEIRIFEAQIREELAKVEIYEAELRGVDVLERVNQRRVDTLRARIAASQQKVDLYRSRIEAVNTELRARVLQLEVYRTEVQAFAARVNERRLAVDLYSALVRGDEGVLRARLAELDAFRIRETVRSQQNEQRIQQAQAVTAFNRNLTEIFRGEVQAYLADVDVGKTEADVELGKYRAQIAKYVNENSVRLDTLQTEYAKYRTDLRRLNLQAGYDVRINLGNAQLFMEHIKHASDTAVGVGRVYGDIAASYGQAANSIAEIGNITTQES